MAHCTLCFPRTPPLWPHWTFVTRSRRPTFPGSPTLSRLVTAASTVLVLVACSSFCVGFAPGATLQVPTGAQAWAVQRAMSGSASSGAGHRGHPCSLGESRLHPHKHLTPWRGHWSPSTAQRAHQPVATGCSRWIGPHSGTVLNQAPAHTAPTIRRRARSAPRHAALLLPHRAVCTAPMNQQVQHTAWPPADLPWLLRELAAPLDGCGGPSRSGAPPPRHPVRLRSRRGAWSALLPSSRSHAPVRPSLRRWLIGRPTLRQATTPPASSAKEE